MHGLPTIGTIGFGWFEVSGRSRVPSPPAITTALTLVTSMRRPPRIARYADATQSTPAPTAMPSPVQKTHSGHAVRSCVTMHEAEARVQHPRRRLAERG